jgi:hypothetical protein
MSKRVGRPSKFSPAVVKVICNAVADGVPMIHAATIAGVSFEWVCQHRRRSPEFDRQIRESTSAGIQSRLAVVKRAMESADDSIALRAATWWLTHTPGSAEFFSESRRVELTGDGDLFSGAQIAVLVWPHQQKQNEILDAEKDHPAIAAPDAN